MWLSIKLLVPNKETKSEEVNTKSFHERVEYNMNRKKNKIHNWCISERKQLDLERTAILQERKQLELERKQLDLERTAILQERKQLELERKQLQERIKNENYHIDNLRSTTRTVI